MPDESTSGKIAWGFWILLLSGGALFMIGAARFVLSHRFGFRDAIYYCLAFVPAALFLLVFAYVLQHAKLVSVIPLFVGGMLGFKFPVADIALGLALMGAVAGPALSEWKEERRLLKSESALGGRNE